jgi:hypothetical protein
MLRFFLLLENFQAFHKDFVGRQSEVDQLNSLASELPSSAVVQVNALESLDYINSQMQTLRRRMELFPVASSATDDASITSPAAISSSASQRRLQMTAISFSSDPLQFERDLEQLNTMLSNVEEELRTPLIQDYTFEFSSQSEDEVMISGFVFVQLRQNCLPC